MDQPAELAIGRPSTVEMLRQAPEPDEPGRATVGPARRIPNFEPDPDPSDPYHLGAPDEPGAGNGRAVLSSKDDRQTIDPAVLEAIAAEYGLVGPPAWQLAEKVAGQIATEQARGLARRIVGDATLERDAALHGIEVGTAGAMLALDRPPSVPLLGELLYEGHNATVTARYKVGKSTLVENVCAAAAAGGTFLGRYCVPRPLRVALLNYELTPQDMDARLRRLGLGASVLERIYVMNLRGHRLPVWTKVGRSWLVGQLAHHGAEIMVIDPFGAAFSAAGGESENDNAEVRRFLTALDEVKAFAGCPTLVMPVHTGRGEQVEGDERGRGATALDDWADVRFILTRDKDKARFLRTEGRAVDLDESRLTFDPATGGLGLGMGDVGMSRRDARRHERMALVVRVVSEEPGLNVSRLREQLSVEGVTNNEEKAGAVADARAARMVHIHPGERRSVCHYAGADHVSTEPCPGGWRPC